MIEERYVHFSVKVPAQMAAVLSVASVRSQVAGDAKSASKESMNSIDWTLFNSSKLEKDGTILKRNLRVSEWKETDLPSTLYDSQGTIIR